MISLKKFLAQFAADDFKYRAAWNSHERKRINSFLTPVVKLGLLTNRDNAIVQVKERRDAGYKAWLEDEKGNIVRGV